MFRPYRLTPAIPSTPLVRSICNVGDTIIVTGAATCPQWQFTTIWHQINHPDILVYRMPVIAVFP